MQLEKPLETITKEEWRDMSDNEREALLHEAMQGYEDFSDFLPHCGWQDWMEYYTDSLEGVPPLEDAFNTIYEILQDAWLTR